VTTFGQPTSSQGS